MQHRQQEIEKQFMVLGRPCPAARKQGRATTVTSTTATAADESMARISAAVEATYTAAMPDASCTSSDLAPASLIAEELQNVSCGAYCVNNQIEHCYDVLQTRVGAVRTQFQLQLTRDLHPKPNNSQGRGSWAALSSTPIATAWMENSVPLKPLAGSSLELVEQTMVAFEREHYPEDMLEELQVPLRPFFELLAGMHPIIAQNLPMHPMHSA